MTSDFAMRFPATSANLGPAFDAAAVALSPSLDVTAARADDFLIEATGRDQQACSDVKESLILQTYRDLLRGNGVSEPPGIAMRMHNEIPLGMGLGSSAAARLAGICLANKFGNLEWKSDQILAEAIRLEGHPDNAVACWLGGFTVAGSVCSSQILPSIARFETPRDWSAMLVMQETQLATGKARAALPDSYLRDDAVKNVQATALLVAAFAQRRGDLLRAAMQDTLHQPYRSQFCPLLETLADMGNVSGVLGVALSGSGPGVILIVERSAATESLRSAIQSRTAHLPDVEILTCDFSHAGARESAVQTTL